MLRPTGPTILTPLLDDPVSLASSQQHPPAHSVSQSQSVERGGKGEEVRSVSVPLVLPLRREIRSALSTASLTGSGSTAAARREKTEPERTGTVEPAIDRSKADEAARATEAADVTRGESEVENCGVEERERAHARSRAEWSASGHGAEGQGGGVLRLRFVNTLRAVSACLPAVATSFLPVVDEMTRTGA
eukprot:3933361-Rhodomonas_salina.1